MNDRNKEWNEKSLTAWNQWKSICSICGCSDEYKHILMIEVVNAFQKKLHSVIGNQLDSLFSDSYEATTAGEEKTERAILPSQSGELPSDGSFYHSEDFDEKDIDKDKDLEDLITPEDANELNPDDAENQEQGNKTEKLFRVDWAHEFDCGIIEKANSGKSPKNYKDHTWECINRSDDPPLKIIRGQLLGHLGIINEIAERFLRNNFHQIWEKQISLQLPIGADEESGTLEDTIADKEKSCSLDQSDKDYLQNSFRNLFANDNAAIFLVYLTGFSSMFIKKISISIPELQKYVGLSSTSPIYDRLNNVILPKVQGLSPECLQSMSVPRASDFLIFLLIEQIKPEKRACSLLQKVTNEMGNTQKRENEK